jgi:L-asparaginase / beta-aspartyl-peptidase
MTELPPVVAVHAGAGDRTASLNEGEPAWHASLRTAIDRARAVLEAGGAALDAVQAAVAYMEDEADHLNAGRGSVLCADGTVEMSAALMNGEDRAAGGVACVRHTRNPIAAARLVLASERVLMVGARAEAWAAAAGAEQRDPGYFVTDRQRARLRDQLERADGGTVGAVCRDRRGALAAATSTGGIRGQLPGRVGDAPMIGAGTWADGVVAVSCTGQGEAFVRSAAAHRVAALRASGVGLARAARLALDAVAEVGGSGGLIALDAGGGAALPFSSEVMPRALWVAGREPLTWIDP